MRQRMLGGLDVPLDRRWSMWIGQSSNPLPPGAVDAGPVRPRPATLIVTPRRASCRENRRTQSNMRQRMLDGLDVPIDWRWSMWIGRLPNPLPPGAVDAGLVQAHPSNLPVTLQRGSCAGAG